MNKFKLVRLVQQNKVNENKGSELLNFQVDGMQDIKRLLGYKKRGRRLDNLLCRKRTGGCDAQLRNENLAFA
jgi:hypothetical protein